VESTKRRDLRVSLAIVFSAARSDNTGSWWQALDSLRSQADADDREWLEDRIQDGVLDVGYGYESASVMRRLHTMGLRGYDDDDPSEGPYSTYVSFAVRPAPGRSADQFAEALALLAAGRGIRETTWGYDRHENFELGDGLAWISDSRCGLEPAEKLDALNLALADMASIGILPEQAGVPLGDSEPTLGPT
jgi:hypothetical protein